MTPTTYRRRPDGVYEIVRARIPLRKLERLFAVVNVVVGISCAAGAAARPPGATALVSSALASSVAAGGAN